MSEETKLLTETAERLLADHLGEARPDDGARDSSRDGALWQAVEAAGLPLLLLPEAAGGLGLAPGDAWGVLAALGKYAAPAPVAETILAGRLLADHGLGSAAGPATVAIAGNLTASKTGAGWLLGGSVDAPAAGQAEICLAVAQAEGRHLVCRFPLAGLDVAPARTLGGDPVGRIALDGVILPADAMAETNDGGVLIRQGAILRAVQMAGALAAVLDLSVGYTQERVQFGRPLAKFQAIQQQLAELAAEAALATAAARTALDRFDDPDALFEVAAAKSQAGEAASRAAAIAHQVHGAIGFTREYALHHLTRRLWAWREEFGSEAFWQRRLGQLVAQQGADALWPQIAAG
jgi:alkylation response protein AidB-like acyl-CoA dehydrogenase